MFFCSNCSFLLGGTQSPVCLEAYINSEKEIGCLRYLGDYTTQVYGDYDYNIPL